MAADLLALEHEIREGRLSLDNFSKGRLVLASFDEGVLEYDFDSYKGSMPEGYILRYGSDKKGRIGYFVNIEALIKAEESSRWMNVALHTDAKASAAGGIMIKRTDDKVPGYRTTAEIRYKEWNIARQYAVRTKRARSLEALPKELERYTCEAINQLSDHLGILPKKYPKVELKNDKKAISRYNIPGNRIIFTTIKHSAIYEEAGHCLHAGYMPEIPDEGYPLDILFRKTIEEAIGYYCAKFGDRSKGFEDMVRLYWLASRDVEKAETRIANAMLSLDVDEREAIRLSAGEIHSQKLLEAHEYVNSYDKLWRLSHHMGMKLGEKIFREKERRIITDLITSQDTRYPYVFFRNTRLLRLMDELWAQGGREG